MKYLLIILLFLVSCTKNIEMPIIQKSQPEIEYYVKRYVKQVSLEYYYNAYYHQGMDSAYYYADEYINNSYMTKVLDTIYNSIKTGSIWHYSKSQRSYNGTWVYTKAELFSISSPIEFQDTIYNYFSIEDSAFIQKIDDIIVQELIKRYCPL